MGLLGLRDLSHMAIRLGLQVSYTNEGIKICDSAEGEMLYWQLSIYCFPISGLSFVTLPAPYIYNIDAIIQDSHRVELLAAEVERLKV